MRLCGSLNTESFVALYLACLVPFMICKAGRFPQKSFPTNNYNVGFSHTVHNPSPNSFVISEPCSPKSGIDQSIHKRRVPIRPPKSKPSTTPNFEKIHTITFFKIDFVYTDKDLPLIKAILRKFPEVIALGIVGIEFEPRHDLLIRWGALTLNLYDVAEALTQAVVLAVSRRLAQMALRGLVFLGRGEVVVGAGVRVLFAAGIRLQGLEDINMEVVQPLLGFVG